MAVESLNEIDLRPVVFVYSLCEPETGEVRYIGRTLLPEARCEQHCNRSANKGVREWVNDLRRRGRQPVMVVIRRVDGWKEGIAAEREEIEAHRAVAADRLLNHSPKGQRQPIYLGPKKQRTPDPKESQRRLIRARMQAKCDNQTERRYQRQIASGNVFAASAWKIHEKNIRKRRRELKQLEQANRERVA